MTSDEHCERCKQVLGEPFIQVHLWLDEFHGKPPWMTKHRKFRHHWEGIEWVRQRWGNKAAEAAKLHIVDDLKTGQLPTALAVGS